MGFVCKVGSRGVPVPLLGAAYVHIDSIGGIKPSIATARHHGRYGH